jgi:putative hydrolase of the HAD superfamily
VPFLQGLKAQGYRLYLATGDHGPQKAQQLHRIAGERLLVDAFDPDTLGHQKGTREYVERALALAGASAGHTWAIGDSLRNDVAPALEAGLRALWLNRKSEQRRREDPLPTRTVPDLKQALAAILALEQELERPA